MIVRCKSIADDIKTYVRELLASSGAEASLAIIQVGDDAASTAYIKGKVADCCECGIKAYVFHLPACISTEDLQGRIRELNEDARVTGIIVQLPLPEHLNIHAVLNTISPSKDVDCLTATNIGKLHSGQESFMPCTPQGIMHILHDINLDGKHCVVIGRSDIVGRPMAEMLLRRNATVTICHSHTRGLKYVTLHADVIVVAVGKPKLITADMVRPGAYVVDVGINRVDGKLCGDVDTAAVAEIATVTAVPGGVGLTTRAALMLNVMKGALQFDYHP